MMVHISRFNDIQQQIADILNEWLARVIAALRNYAALSAEKAEEIDEIHKLHATFLKLSLDNKAGVSWDCLRTEFLFKAAAPVEVRTVNMRTGPASLDYSLHKMDGLRVIAIGGDSFSRGLTLEGLCVTYFCRTTAMYDTLLQMGRWFGYRPNYADLVKIWMTQGEIDWYGEITSATMELRDEIQRMRNEHKTPREFGLRVKQAPGSLIVTARNKMRTATQIEQPVSVSGRLLETPRLMADYAILEDNKNVFTSFVARLPEYGTRLMGCGDGGGPSVIPVAVDEGIIRRDRQSADGQLHGLHPGAEDVRCVDLLCTDGGHRPRLGLCYNHIVERIAFFRCQLLRVI